MATVWRAEHVALGRDVAVKFISVTGPSRSKYVERFLREAKLAASIRHRNVVDILDFGRSEEGLPYMVLEFLHGESLADRLARSPRLTLDEVLGIVVLSLGGLAAVHNAGVVHRDLKPENIFLVTEEDGVFPKLLDFGVSKSVDPERTDARGAPLTQEGVLVGTPQYMAPEQARGMKDIDRRADLWAMGVIFYEMLAGRLPYDAEHVGDLLLQIVTTDAPPLSFYRPDLGTELDAVLAKALARDRGRRFQDAKEMRSAVIAAATRLGEAAGVWGRITPGQGVDRPPDFLTPITGVVELAALQAAALRASQTAAQPSPADAQPPPADAQPSSADARPPPADAQPSSGDAQPSVAAARSDAKPSVAAAPSDAQPSVAAAPTGPVPAFDDAAIEVALAATLPAVASPATRRDPTDDAQVVRNSRSLPPAPLPDAGSSRGGAGRRVLVALVLLVVLAGGAALALDADLRAQALAALGISVPGTPGVIGSDGPVDAAVTDASTADLGSAGAAPGDDTARPSQGVVSRDADAAAALGVDPSRVDASMREEGLVDAAAEASTAELDSAGAAPGDVAPDDAALEDAGLPADAAAADADGITARGATPVRRPVKRRTPVRRTVKRRPR
jgi:serine/threonine-protein kinase